MQHKIVYLSGGMEEEKHVWREKAKKLLKGGIIVIDPTRIPYNGRNANEIVEMDKKDITASDYLLVYYTRPSVGTSMKIMYAYTHNIAIYTVNELKQDLSPWMVYHSDKIFNTLEEAIEVINGHHADFPVS